MMPSRLGMTVAAFVPSGSTMREFVERVAGRKLEPWELDALEISLMESEKEQQERREAFDRDLRALTVSMRFSFGLLPIPTLGPGLGEPGRIASAIRCARRRKRNRAAAASRRRNRK